MANVKYIAKVEKIISLFRHIFTQEDLKTIIFLLYFHKHSLNKMNTDVHKSMYTIDNKHQQLFSPLADIDSIEI